MWTVFFFLSENKGTTKQRKIKPYLLTVLYFIRTEGSGEFFL